VLCRSFPLFQALFNKSFWFWTTTVTRWRTYEINIFITYHSLLQTLWDGVEGTHFLNYCYLIQLLQISIVQVMYEVSDN
jgi:hypothetical protein